MSQSDLTPHHVEQQLHYATASCRIVQLPSMPQHRASEGSRVFLYFTVQVLRRAFRSPTSRTCIRKSRTCPSLHQSLTHCLVTNKL